MKHALRRAGLGRLFTAAVVTLVAVSSAPSRQPAQRPVTEAMSAPIHSDPIHVVPVVDVDPPGTVAEIIAECESGDHDATSIEGSRNVQNATGFAAFGHYQFTSATWQDPALNHAEMTGTSNPLEASFAQQTNQFWLHARERGLGPWRASIGCWGPVIAEHYPAWHPGP